jgi:hypothetical protein
MPIVPRIAPAPLPGPQLSGNVSDAAFGGGAGSVTTGLNQGVSALHSEAAQIAQQERQKALEIGLTANRADLSAARNDVLFGPDGALTKQGKDAFDAPETFHANYYARVGQIRAGIKDDDQRDRFDQMVAADYSQADEQVQSHVAAQRQRYDTQSTSYAVENAQNLALQSYDQPNIVEPLIKTIRDVTTAFGGRNGWSDDETAAMINKRVSDTRFGVLSQMLDNDQDLAAGQYFQAHRGELAGPQLLEAEKLVEAGSLRGDSQRQADDITSAALSLGDALTQTRDIPDPRLRDATEARVRRYYEDQAGIQRQTREAAFQQGSSIVEQTGDADKIPLSLRQLMSPEENEALANRASQIRNPKRATNVAVYTHLINLSALNDATRAQFTAMDLSPYRAQLSDGDYTRLLDMQRSERLGQDRTADASTRRSQERQESQVVKSSDAAAKASAPIDALRSMLRAKGESEDQINKTIRTVLSAQPTAPKVTVPQWMVDSAAHDPEYADYLRQHHVPIAAAGSAAPVAPKVPSASPTPTRAPAGATPSPTRARAPGGPLPSKRGFNPTSLGLTRTP